MVQVSQRFFEDFMAVEPAAIRNVVARQGALMDPRKKNADGDLPESSLDNRK